MAANGSDLSEFRQNALARRELRLSLLTVLVTATLLRVVLASAELGPGRFWDERYSFENVAEILIAGELRPANALYPSLSFLPHTAVLAVSDWLFRLSGLRAFSIFRHGGETWFSPTAYFLSRGVSVFFGVWSLWLLYRLGCRVLDPASALLGTLLLASFWRHVRASAEFKPDIIAVALVLVSLGWSLRAARGRTWPAFCLRV